MYTLPETLRAALAKPLAPVLDTGRAVAELRDAPRVVAVGDVVTEMLLDHGIVPLVAVVDFKTKRAALGEPGKEPLRAKIEAAGFARRERFENPPARITRTLWDAVAAALKHDARTVLEVVGEEDLAVLPAAALAPDGTKIVYGQPNEGAVVLTVNPATRERVRGFLSQMENR